MAILRSAIPTYNAAGVLAGSLAAVLVAAAGHAQTDEIQGYDAEINRPGQFSLQLHNNYTPIGRKEPDFRRGIIPNHTLNGVPNGPGALPNGSNSAPMRRYIREPGPEMC